MNKYVLYLVNKQSRIILSKNFTKRKILSFVNIVYIWWNTCRQLNNFRTIYHINSDTFHKAFQNFMCLQSLSQLWMRFAMQIYVCSLSGIRTYLWKLTCTKSNANTVIYMLNAKNWTLHLSVSLCRTENSIYKCI